MTPECFVHYQTGIEEIDRQHWSIFKLLDVVESAVKGKREGDVKYALDAFFDALDMHCAYEDALMRESEYPHYNYHKTCHPESSLQLKRDCYCGASHPDIQGMMLMLRNHIDRADIQFADWYLTQGRDATIAA